MAMIRDGKVYRNLPEQVQKNKEDIEGIGVGIEGLDERVTALENAEPPLQIENLQDGEALGSIQSVYAIELDEHAKGGTAVNRCAVALGIGDTYTVSGNVYNINPYEIYMDDTCNPNWQNMVAEYIYGGLYKLYYRIVSVSGNVMELDASFPETVLNDRVTFNIITEVAKGQGSLVEGTYNQAFGQGAHAEGIACKAVGDGSHAEGYFTLANQARSHAEGDHTIAAGVSQTAIGKYNAIDFNSLFVVGYGTDESHRKTAIKVDEDGYLRLSKDPTHSNDAATKWYVDSEVNKVQNRLNYYDITVTNSNNITWTWRELLPTSQATITEAADYVLIRNGMNAMSMINGSAASPIFAVDASGPWCIVIYNGGLRIVQGTLGTRTTISSFNAVLVQ